MAKITIQVDDALTDILDEIASKSKLSPEKYAENIVHGFLENQFRGRMKVDIDNRSFAELKEYDLSSFRTRVVTPKKYGV